MSRSWTRLAAMAAAVALAVSAAGSLRAQRVPRAPETGEWPEYAGDARGFKSSPLAQIDETNIHDLKVAWRWASADRGYQLANPAMRSTRSEDTPLVVNGTMYTVTPLGMVAALDPATGAQ